MFYGRVKHLLPITTAWRSLIILTVFVWLLNSSYLGKSFWFSVSFYLHFLLCLWYPRFYLQTRLKSNRLLFKKIHKAALTREIINSFLLLLWKNEHLTRWIGCITFFTFFLFRVVIVGSFVKFFLFLSIFLIHLTNYIENFLLSNQANHFFDYYLKNLILLKHSV